MADEMTRDEFSDYMAAFEQRMADRFGRTDRRLDGFDRRFDKVDARLDSIDGRLDSMDGRLDSMDERLDEHDRRFDAAEKEMKRGFSELSGGLANLKQSMEIQFEAARQDFKLSLEVVERVEQNTEAGFSEMRRDHAEHKTVLERSIHHVRTRTEPVEKRLKPTRRRG